MADFLQAFESMIRNEGGYKLHSVEGDRGGMTYAGIARKRNPQWPGWAAIDRGEITYSDLTGNLFVLGGTTFGAASTAFKIASDRQGTSITYTTAASKTFVGSLDYAI